MSSKTLLLNAQETGEGNRPNAAEALSDDEINILYEKKKTSWEFQTENHLQTHFGSSIHCILVYEDVENIGKCAGETFSS